MPRPANASGSCHAVMVPSFVKHEPSTRSCDVQTVTHRSPGDAPGGDHGSTGHLPLLLCRRQEAFWQDPHRIDFPCGCFRACISKDSLKGKTYQTLLPSWGFPGSVPKKLQDQEAIVTHRPKPDRLCFTVHRSSEGATRSCRRRVLLSLSHSHSLLLAFSKDGNCLCKLCIYVCM